VNFQQFVAIAQIIPAGADYFLLVNEWSAKRDMLAVLIADIPSLLAAHMETRCTEYAGNASIQIIDAAPRIRLGFACESAAGALYGISEIAAQCANAASKRVIPASFNRLRKKLESEPAWLPELNAALGNLTWYKRVRELRTEWAHYSTIFIGGPPGAAPVLIARAQRRHSERVEYAEEVSMSLSEFIDGVSRAIDCLDRFAGYLLHNYMVPMYDLDAELDVPELDPNGWPRQHPDHRFIMRRATIRQLLAERGLSLA
jgi:hypothetical protein